MCYHKLYQALLEEGNLPEYFTSIWEKDKKLFKEEQEELEKSFLNFDTIIDDEEYTD
jgi:hypothetical protein